MSDKDIKNPSIEELLAVINSLIKENEFLKFENDTLIKQNKLHIAVFDKQQRRIENLNHFNDLLNQINHLPDSNIEDNTSKNESKLSGDDGEQLKIEMNTSSNESNTSSNESNTSSNESITSNNESITSNNESITSNNESITSNNESNTSNNESNTSNNESNTSNNESNTSNNESNTSNNESNTSNNESNTSNNESNTSNNESNTSNNESKTSNNESKTSNNESKTSNNESKTSNNESNTSNNESITSNNESYTSSNESYTSNNESNSRNNESIIQNIEKNIRINIDNIPINKENNSEEEVIRVIKEKLAKKFGKKYFDKTLSRYADEIFFINKNEKIRVEEIQSYTNISFPAIMRDILFLKKHKWIEKVGPHKGGHYALTKNGKELCEKELK